MKEVLAVQRTDEAFAYFYFDRRDSSRCFPSAAICSLTRQLSVTADGRAMHRAVVGLYETREQRSVGSGQVDDDAAKQLLRDYVDTYPQTTIVLDALDECDYDSRGAFVSFIEDLTCNASKPVKVFISSRLEVDIAERLKGWPCIAIGATDNQDDIATLVKAELERRASWTQRISADLRAEVVRTLCQKSGGM
jgi:hypothetical protein